jgi:signal transduction histidine kinase
MVSSLWKSWPVDVGNIANLADLRSQLTHRLAVLLIIVSGLTMWLILPQKFFSLTEFLLFATLLGLGALVVLLEGSYPGWARHVLVWGANGVLLAAMWLFAEPWLPFAGLLLVFVNALLISGSELASAGLIAALATWLAFNRGYGYPLISLYAILALGVAVAWLAVRTLYTTLQWTSNMQQRADMLLDEVRNHRAELSRALKSSEIANALLRRTQRELIVARKHADEARQMKEQFAANISHELRTPLNLILGFSEMMHRSPDVYGDFSWPPPLRRDVYQIYRSSRHLIEMIDDILDLSRFEMAAFTLNKEATALTLLLQDTAAIAADLFRAAAVEFVADIPADLPALALDRTRIRQVLLNLLNNARRFTAAGQVKLTARQTETEVIISVADTGPGIPANKLAYVFDEFYQVDLSLRRSHQGAGLGLAISKRFVQMHGGSIWVNSHEDRGSEFFFSLPRVSPAVTLLPDAPGAPEPAWPDDARPCLLVVDSDPGVSAMVRRRLNDYQVVQVSHAQELPEAVILHHPRAVIHNVPPGDKAATSPFWPNIPAPVLTCSLPSQVWLADDLAVAASLTKPVSADQLLHEVERIENVEDILVIDDDRGFAQLVQRILESTGRPFRVRRAYDGEDGLVALEAARPDLVLLDLIMPGKDGFEVLEEIRRNPALSAIPVVLLTATSFAEDALAQAGGQVVVNRAGGLRLAEVLACVEAVVDVLEPHYES